MPTYRFELARSGRAGCQTAECKKSGDKIAKDELRVGTWTDNERIQSWMWRHWGCLTPKIISHMQESIQIDGSDGYDFEQIDGYEELSEDLQDKIRNAIETGHIPDEDWKGDVEFNRPGKTGFRARGKKAEPKDKATDSGEESPVKKKKRGDADSDDEEEKPTKKKRVSKAKTADTPSATPTTGKKPNPQPKTTNDDGEAEEKPKRGRKPKTVENADDKAPIAATESKQRPRRSAAPKPESLAEASDEEPKRNRRNKAAKKNGADDSDKPKRGRPKKTQNGNDTADAAKSAEPASEPVVEPAADDNN